MKSGGQFSIHTGNDEIEGMENEILYTIYVVHMQHTRELCPEFVWKYSQPVSENTGLDGLCLQELVGLPTLGILWVPERAKPELHVSYQFPSYFNT